MSEKSNLVMFAENELARLGDDEGQSAMNKHLIEMVKIFSNEGHSGFSASYATRILERLLRFLPLTAIEDTAEDWNEVSEGLYQHRRCSSVFKNKNRFEGKAYNVEGRIFSDDNGKTWFTNDKSKATIDFPYLVPTHPTEYLVFENGDINCEYKR